ncbi:MAG: tyrosine-type recombinase/integrase [Chitinophagaceae bacterium]|nr:tyrosine-type recombinase/integrase [Chitinophagaceae bacterium]
MKDLEAKASVDFTALKVFLEKRKKVITTSATPAVLPASQPGADIMRAVPVNPVSRSTAWQLCDENLHALQNFIEVLLLKSYSASIIKTYRNEFMQLLQLLKHKPVDSLTVADLKRYMVFAMENQGISENTAHSRLNALKFYFEQVLERERFFWEIPRPKKPTLLPKLLNETEIKRLFNALTNKKHKAMLFTAYSAGLRVSEIVHLKIADIDSRRMQIFIARAKGKKDRYVNLSPVVLDILRNYMKEYRPKPKIYLFESDQTGGAYPTRTVQQIFTNAKNKAGIKKDVGVHSLRHSFATHLLDKGTDIKYIKDLLGHFNIKTTERYLHVSKQQLVNIVSPFDDLWKNEQIDW